MENALRLCDYNCYKCGMTSGYLRSTMCIGMVTHSYQLVYEKLCTNNAISLDQISLTYDSRMMTKVRGCGLNYLTDPIAQAIYLPIQIHREGAWLRIT